MDKSKFNSMKREIKDHPILFSTPMVQAILEGRKTQTRRVVKIDGMLPYTGNKPLITHECGSIYYFWGHKEVKCPYGQPGDVLWVRESFKWDVFTGGYSALYKADYKTNFGGKWKPSIHMPKSACRLFLGITNVRVERLHDISEDDAKAEGIQTKAYGSHPYFCTRDYLSKTNSDGFWPGFCADTGDQYRSSFQTLWQSINGEQSWNENPWVWVIEFQRIEKE
jgi:hypothetical protein